MAQTVGTGGPSLQAENPKGQSLASLVSTIPVAVEGEVISSEYHNSLRAAVLALADILGAGAVQRNFTLMPALIKTDGLPEWRFTSGVASAPAHQQNTISGILPVLLPNGAAIQAMIVRGRRVGSVAGLETKLVRQPTRSGESTSLIDLPLESVTTDGAGFFEATGDLVKSIGVKVGDSAMKVILEDLRTVNNDDYKYFISAEADGVGDLVEIYSFQVACSH